MLDVDTLLQAEEVEHEQPRAGSFSFKNIAKHIIKRQDMKKDAIIVLCGDRGQGKSNYMIRLIVAYIKEVKKANPDFKWSWKTNFAMTPAEAPGKAAALPDRSFIVMDEAADIAYRGDANTIKTKNLVKFFNKSREKLLFTIWVLPDIYQLNPKILNMCIMLIIVPYRYKDVCSSAFINGRSPNALTQDKFGLERIQRLLNSRRMTPAIHSAALDGTAKVNRDGKEVDVPYPKQLFNFYKSLPGFKYSHWFGPAPHIFEERYIKHVKSKQLMAHETEEKYVRKRFYETLKRRYQTVLYNLHEKGDMSYQQIANLHLDENGMLLARRENIAQQIGGVKARFEL